MYEWNIGTQKREGESVLKSCSYTCVAVSPDGKTVFAVGSDRTLKEITDGQVRVLFCYSIIHVDMLTGAVWLNWIPRNYPCGP